MSSHTPLESRTAPIPTLVIGDDDRSATEALSRDDRVDARPASRSTLEQSDLHGIDCVVATAPDPSAHERVRECDATLPFVYFIGESPPRPDDEWTDHVPYDEPDSLPSRIHRLVDLRRGAVLVGGAARASGDAVAIVDPEGTVEAATDAFSTPFGYDPESLAGRVWADLVPSTERHRLADDAIPTAEDGWQWAGHCTFRTREDDQFTARTTVAGTDDGRFVLVIEDLEDE